ncbi:MAG: rhodanese-like domain-containing protein [Cyanobacteria bacterium P01_A01_bin.105]
MIAIVVAGLLVGCGPAIASDLISAVELAEQIELGTAPLVVDVRSVEEYATGHVPGAINIPFREIDQYLDELRTHASLVVYCERGVRANIAETTLADAGFDQVLHLEGDMSGWRAANLPTDTVHP